MLAYQVCEWTTSTEPAAPTAAVIAMSVESTWSAGFAPSEPVLLLGVRGGTLPRLAHAVHVDVDQPAQLTDQEVDVHTGTAVHVGRELAGEDRCAHAPNVVPTRHRCPRVDRWKVP